MAVVTVVKTIGSTGDFSTPQLWEEASAVDLVTSEQSPAGTFVGTFTQGENLTFSISGVTGKFLHSDHATFITYGITNFGNPATSDVVTGVTSGATCILSSGVATFTGVIWQGQCQNQEFAGAGTQLTIDTAAITSTVAYVHLTTAPGASFRDNATVRTNALRYNTANGCGIRTTGTDLPAIFVFSGFTVIENLQCAGTGTGGSGIRYFGAGTTNPPSPRAIDFCILEGTYTGTSTSIGVLGSAVSSGEFSVRNCVIVQRASGADHIIGVDRSAPSFYNCTIAAVDDLATAPTNIFRSHASSAETITVQNCGLFAGNSTKTIKVGSAAFNFTTCYSDISGTAGVTQTTYSSEFENVNDATRDFRLKLGAAQIDSGTTDTTNAAIDISQTLRPQGAVYDVGAWEFMQTAPAAPGDDDGDVFLITQAAA